MHAEHWVNQDEGRLILERPYLKGLSRSKAEKKSCLEILKSSSVKLSLKEKNEIASL